MADELSLVIENPHEGEFLKHIDWNKEEFMELVASITQEYDGLAYAEDQMKAAKADRARLNAMKKAISDRRIQVKNAVMAPYMQFEHEVKEVIALIEKPISMIDLQIREYEERTKAEKQEKLEEYFREIAADLEGILRFDMVFDPRYLNASVSLKKAKEDIGARVEQFRADLRTIETVCEEKYHTAVKDCYMRTMNISKALEEAGRLKELDRKLEEERARKAEEARIIAEREAAERAAREAASKEGASVGKTAEATVETLKSASQLEEGVSKPEDKALEMGADVSVPAERGQKSAENVQKPVESVVVPPAGDTAVSDPFAPQEDTKQYKASFTVYGTKAQIMALKQYMVDNNIRFGKEEKRDDGATGTAQSS